jgi:predicted nuclease of predicted toxin-antitoxin system
MNNLPSPKDLIKTGAQFAYPIQWRRWEVINIFITQFNWKIGVEIGVNEGENIFEIAKNNSKLKIYGVDPYKIQKENILYNEEYNDESLSIIKRKILKESLKYPNLKIIIDRSDNASKQFDKESIDFVFIDGDHSYESVKTDINCWEPKVKEDGLIMGHDYNWGDVARAVGERFTEVWILSDNVWAASKVWLRND